MLRPSPDVSFRRFQPYRAAKRKKEFNEVGGQFMYYFRARVAPPECETMSYSFCCAGASAGGIMGDGAFNQPSALRTTCLYDRY